MPEQILINGKAVDVPVEIESEGRAAVADWHQEQLAALTHVENPATPAIAPTPPTEE